VANEKMLADLIASESNMKALAVRLAPGCVYNKTTESDTRIGPQGNAQVRTRTCREVKDCSDSAYNVPKNCDDWSDWRDA